MHYAKAPDEGRRLAVNVYRAKSSMRSLEAATDPAGGIALLQVEIDRDAPDIHEYVRITIMGPAGVHYDNLISLSGSRGWVDLRDIALREAKPLPVAGVLEPGTQIRLAPYESNGEVMGQDLLAIQGPLDSLRDDEHLIQGGWAAEWPGSFWNSAVLVGEAPAFHRLFVIARTVTNSSVHWLIHRDGDFEGGLVQSRVGDHAARFAWHTDSWSGIDLTPDLGGVRWEDLAAARLELASVPFGEELTTDTKWLHVPLETR